MNNLTEILIDYSSSMKGNRIKIAKRILKEEILPVLDYSGKVAIKLFFAGQPHWETDTIKTLQALKQCTLTELDKLVDSIDTPGGNTPIAFAINQSVKSLKNYPDDNRKVILLTDGEENRGGDYKAAAQNANNLHGIPCRFYILGLDQKPLHEKKAREIAAISGGKYINFSTKNYTQTYASQEFKTFKTDILHTSSSEYISSFCKKKETPKLVVKENVQTSLPKERILSGTDNSGTSNIAKPIGSTNGTTIQPVVPKVPEVVVAENKPESVTKETKDTKQKVESAVNPTNGELSAEVNLRLISDFIDDYFGKHQNLNNLQQELETYEDYIGYILDPDTIDAKQIMIIPVMAKEKGLEGFNEVLFKSRDEGSPIKKILVILDEWNQSEEVYFSRQARFFRNGGGDSLHIKINGFPGVREMRN